MQKLFILLGLVGILFVSAVPSKYPTNTTIQLVRGSTPCNSGYYWTTQSCMPCSRTQIANADTCICSVANVCTTLTCNSGFMASSDQTSCVPNNLPQGCLTYGQGPDAIVCYTCDTTQYTLIGGVCIPSLNCQTFSLTSSECLTCQDSFYLNANNVVTNTNYISGSIYFNQFGSQCLSCMKYCSKCSSNSTCSSCQSGYYWNFNINNQNGPGACQSCASNCAQCTDSTVQACTTCIANYFLDPNTKACATCNITGCQTCGSVSTCGTCSTGYTVSSDSKSCGLTVQVTCSAGCQACTNSTSCTSCLSNFALINSACYQCSNGCQGCGQLGNSTTTTCKFCQDTFSLAKGTDQTVANNCTQCSTSNPNWLRCAGLFELSPLTTLAPTQCPDNFFLALVNGTNACIAYQTPNTCLTIENGNSNDCLLCLPGLQKLTSTNCQSCPNSCTTCGANNGTVVCTACQNGFYLSSDSKSCIQCAQGCSACSSGTVCTTCQSNYYLNGNNLCTQCSQSNCAVCPNNLCTSCQNTFFYYTNTTASSIKSGCYQCPTGCQTCQSPGQVCQTCQNGYVLQSQGCVPLTQANCATSDIVLGCTICNYGFFLLNQQCYECVNPYSASVCRTNTGQSTLPSTSTSKSTSTASGSSPTVSTTSSNAYYLAVAITSLIVLIIQ